MRILAMVIAGLLLVAPAAHASDPEWPSPVTWLGCPEPTFADRPISAPAPGQGDRVLVIGDSLTRESRRPLERMLQRDGWNPTVRCWGGKTLEWGIEQVKRARELDQLPDTVVVALGTNDMTWEDRTRTRERIDIILDELGPNREVFWMNLFFDGGLAPSRAKETWFNNQLQKQAQARPNLTVIDWSQQARTAGVRTRDGLHYQPAGSKARARAVAKALAASAATRGVLATPPRNG